MSSVLGVRTSKCEFEHTIRFFFFSVAKSERSVICSPFQSSEAAVKVEVAVLGSPSLISLMVSMDVKQH